jgi:hypothetical protein
MSSKVRSVHAPPGALELTTIGSKMNSAIGSNLGAPVLCQFSRRRAAGPKYARALPRLWTVAIPGCDGHFLAHSGVLMVEEPKTATEIVRMIKERAYIQLGPWPVDLELIIFSTT